MPVKAKTKKAKTSRDAQAEAPESAEVAPEGPDPLCAGTDIPSNINSTHLADMETDLVTILAHPMFEDIVNADPIALALTSGGSDDTPMGHKACFKQAEYNFTMSDKGPGLYDCACNFFWVDARWNPEHGIPINVVTSDFCVNTDSQSMYPMDGEGGHR